MKKNIFIANLLVVFITLNLNAQTDAKAVKTVENMLNLTKTDAVVTDFTMTISSTQSSGKHTSAGKIKMKGNKFALTMNEMSVWFDGKTQWAYMEQTNEVSITNPTEKELSETNPMAVLNAYKATSNISFTKSVSKDNMAIQITPKEKNAEVKNIILSVKKANNYPASILITDKKGNLTNFTLKNFKANQKIADNVFVFDKNLYKNLEINDLR